MQYSTTGNIGAGSGGSLIPFGGGAAPLPLDLW